MLAKVCLGIIAFSLSSSAFADVEAGEKRLEPGARFSINGLGRTQGVEVRGDKVYFYGDASTGVIKEYNYKNGRLDPSGITIRLTQQDKDIIPHPTGLTYHETMGTFIGSTQGRTGSLFYLDWDLARNSRNLNWSVLNVVEDDLAIHGTRPEFVQAFGNWYIATADYGNGRTEVRLYDPFALQTAKKTSESGVLVYRFSCGPFVQNLHWNNSTKELTLVKNTDYGKGWRLQTIDLEASISRGYAVIMNNQDYPEKTDALEGFHYLTHGTGIAVSSSPVGNATILKEK
jgi:hypothetical protein